MSPRLNRLIGAPAIESATDWGSGMGTGVPTGRSVADQVDPLTGLAPRAHLHAQLAWALAERPSELLVVVVVEVPSPTQRVEHARRLALAGDMGRAAFATALAVGRLGVRRVGLLVSHGDDLATRVDLLARMVHDVPALVRAEPVPGPPAFAAWLLDDLAR